MIRYCPECGGAIEIADEEYVEGSVVRHPPGQCPGMEREQEYAYVGTYIVQRYKAPAVADDPPPEVETKYGELTEAIAKITGETLAAEVVEVLIDKGIGEYLVGIELARVSATMTSTTFAPIGAELATRVGVKIEEILQHATVIDSE